MAHMLTLLTRVYRARRGSLDQGEYRVAGDVFYLLRFFLTMPSGAARHTRQAPARAPRRRPQQASAQVLSYMGGKLEKKPHLKN